MYKYREQAIKRQRFAAAEYANADWHRENNRPLEAQQCQHAQYRNSSLAMAYLGLLMGWHDGQALYNDTFVVD